VANPKAVLARRKVPLPNQKEMAPAKKEEEI
jgi:hypothetical protein